MAWKHAAIGDDLRTRVDRALGERVGYAFKNHHRRRLARIGWAHALDAPAGGWAAGEPAPRGGNAVEVLVDGAEYLPRVAEAIRAAESHVHVTGWFFSPEFALERGERPTVLRNLLAEAAERVDVRVLAWAGAPLPLLTPWRGDVRTVRDGLTRGTRIRCALDAHERPMHCHHEKTVVVDDRVAFVGGIDFTLLEGDRFDSSSHPARATLGWHDTAARIDGPAVEDVASHFRLRWREVAGEALPATGAPDAVGDVELQVVRTIPEQIYERAPRGEFQILESYVRAFKGAQRLIYVETQYLWSPELTDILAGKLREPPSDEFRIVFVLPAHPTHGGDNTRGVLAELVDADGGAGRVLACTLYARAARARDPIYVHSKACIVDDEWITVGSANLNDHSIFNDTELNVVSRDAELARRTRLRLWEEHLEESADGDPTEVVDTRWRPIADEQLERRERGEPATHRLCKLPHVSRRSARLLGPLQGLVVDG
jgi:phosphatidylserine/phosphatidylglycerophosphate/cardiolipin synthase-like enzyme